MENHIREWFADERGITQETLDAFGVSENQGAVRFPYGTAAKFRSDPTKEPRRFWFEPKGTSLGLFQSTSQPNTLRAFLVEGETDTMRLDQELSGSADVYGLSGIEGWQPHFVDDYLSKYEKVFVVLDNDTDYTVQARVENSWKNIRRDLGFKRAQRVTLPPEVKDVCEFFDKYDLDALKTLCKRRTRPKIRFDRLDLTKQPPPMNWLVEGLVCAGDVTLMMGDPGLGKSWMTMDLAVAVAEGRKFFLGRPVIRAGRVVYVDEENPEDIIFSRFKKLGLTPRGAENIEYLYRPGIWMNKEPEALLDEVIDLEPTLIVIDSLSRVHSEDENSAGAMAGLFREAITPLSRETGAAVVVIHHSNKGESSNSYIRSRGSGDISAVVDAALDVRPYGTPGTFTVSLYKSRRRAGGASSLVTITDTKEGGVRLVTENDEDLPF